MSHQPLTIILFGAAGSGKGTQGDFLVEKFGLERVEAGALVREAAREESEFGRHVRSIQEAGHLLPNEDIDRIVLNKLRSVLPGSGLLVDGYPRRLVQAQTLEEILRALNRTNIKALVITVSEEEARRRLLNRSMCVNGHTLIGRHYTKCPIDNAAIKVRHDDLNETAINQRLALYREQIIPAIGYYRQKGWVIDINGEQSVEKVRDEVFKKLGISFP